MLREAIATGDTIEQAKEAACRELGVESYEAQFEVLQLPVKKTFGLFGGSPAKVRAFIRRLCGERGKTILLSSHILSEISLAADDIGIIDHGVLLEEESLSELESRNGRHIHLGVSDAAQAARLLETVVHTERFRIDDDRNLRVFDLTLPPEHGKGRGISVRSASV